MLPRLIFVFGGTMSSVGKGICAASLAQICQKSWPGKSVSIIKIDPYLNCDAGMLSPFEHGEVFVLDDGAETDLDLGNYERFLANDGPLLLTAANSITTGQVYKSVIERERQGLYNGKTVQVVPHITDEIQRRIMLVANQNEITVVEVGGTVGDIEMMPFVHSISAIHGAMALVTNVLVTFVPTLHNAEQKTKPTQHVVSQMKSYGIGPHLILGRCVAELHKSTIAKIESLLLPSHQGVVFSCHDVPKVEELPNILIHQGMQEALATMLHFPEYKTSTIQATSASVLPLLPPLRIAIVGKYVAAGATHDTYLSVVKAIEHAAASRGVGVEISFCTGIDDKAMQLHGIIVPGGFGDRGIDDKLEAIQFARNVGLPTLGICLGMQVMAIAAARSIGANDANSTEFDLQTTAPIIDLIDSKSRAMRLGGHDVCLTDEVTINIHGGRTIVRERHRHRYCMTLLSANMYLQESSATVVATSFDANRASQIVEAIHWPSPQQTFCYGTQYHPEFTSKSASKPAPFFVEFIKAAELCRAKKLD